VDDNERLIAELGIRNVVGRLAHLADRGDVEEYVTLFTDDAVWDHPVLGARTGRDDILAGARERRAGMDPAVGSPYRHVITTQWVRIDDQDHGFSQAYWMVVHATRPATVGITGRYDDELRRTPDGWKMARRTIFEDPA